MGGTRSEVDTGALDDGTVRIHAKCRAENSTSADEQADE